MAQQATKPPPLIPYLPPGMGKSTVSAMLADLGVPVLDADAVVHALYARGGSAVGPVGAAFPGTVVDGAVDRAALSKLVVGDEVCMGRPACFGGIVMPSNPPRGRAAFIVPPPKPSAPPAPLPNPECPSHSIPSFSGCYQTA